MCLFYVLRTDTPFIVKCIRVAVYVEWKKFRINTYEMVHRVGLLI